MVLLRGHDTCLEVILNSSVLFYLDIKWTKKIRNFSKTPLSKVGWEWGEGGGGGGG